MSNEATTSAPSHLPWYARTYSHRLYVAALAALGLLLYLPALGRSGFWDPYEIHVADLAKGLVEGRPWNVPLGGHPPLPVWVVAVGFKLFGVNEFAGRFFLMLLSVLLLVATYYLGVAIVRRRAAFLGAFALSTTPFVLMGARQLVSAAPATLGSVLLFGGLLHAARTSSHVGRLPHLALAGIGLAMAQLSSGTLLGVWPWPAALSVALLLSARGRARATAWAIAAVTLLFTAGLLYAARTNGYSSLFGGMVHDANHNSVITTVLKQMGFAYLPWVILLPLGVMTLFEEGATTSDSEQLLDRRFGALALLAGLVAAYAAATAESALVGELPMVLGPLVLLACGAYVDQFLDEPSAQPFSAWVVVLAGAILAHDVFLAPESFIGSHLAEGLRWPGTLTHIPYALLGCVVFFAGVMALGIAFVWSTPAAPDVTTANGKPPQAGRDFFVQVAAGTAVVLSLLTVWWFVPATSKHLSARDLYSKTKALDASAPLGTYHFNAQGAAYYLAGRTPTALPGLDDLFAFLGKRERVFVLVGVDELAPIDQAARQGRHKYLVIDDSNSRYLVLSNALGPNEHDLNPLRLYVTDKPGHPQFQLDVNFDDKLELYGYDMPTEVSVGQDFKVKLYFKVLAPLPSGYKIFMHFDGPGVRFQGDHAPMEGRFPTQHWVAGSYITDDHLVQPDRTQQQSGYYHAFVGLWLGDTRLKVKTGAADGENRVKLGGLTVK